LPTFGVAARSPRTTPTERFEREMAYSTDVTQLLTKQLQRFATSNRHQLAGQVANLGFWCDEVRHCLNVLDGYDKRFHNLKDAQTQYTREHQTVEFQLDDPCCTQQNVPPPKPVDRSQFAHARAELCAATLRFLTRCYNESLINETTLTEMTSSLGIPADSRRNGP
jgi:hypothetical protein